MEKWRKNWRNQLFTVAFLFMMVLLFESISASAASNFTYDVNDDNTATITSCTAEGDVVIPAVIDGYTVVSLQPKLFYGKYNITSVFLPETVTQIGMWDYVFSYCYGLQAINVAADNPAFCSVDGVLFSKDKKILYNYPCAKPGKTYHVPMATKTICCTAFASNANLYILYLDSSETIWYTYTFYNTGDMTVCYLPGGATEERVQSTIENGQNFENNPLYPKFRLLSEDAEYCCETEGHVAGAAATCTVSQKCVVCNEILVEALGHDYDSKIVEPTTTEQGYTLHTCNRCQDSYKDSYIPAHQYEYSSVDENGMVTRTCTQCEDSSKFKAPTTFYLLWGSFYRSSPIYSSKYAVGATLYAWKCGMDGDPEVQEVEFISSNPEVISTEYYSNFYEQLNMNGAGITTITARLKYNPSVSEIYTFRVGEDGALSLNDCIIEMDTSYIYTGSAVVPEITLTYNGHLLVKDTDYSVTVSNNTGVGTGSVTITGTGLFSGSITKDFEIKASATTTEDESNKKTADKPTKFNIKNKKTYKKSKKVTIKDSDGIKSIKLNNKRIKVKSGKKSFSFKLSKYKKYLKKKTKWNKLVVTDVKGREKTIKFKVK